jgi:xylulokinase
VITGTPDVQSAAIGAGTVADYQAHLHIGTSSWLTCHVPFKKTDIANNMASLPSAIPDRYLVANEQEAAGACLTFLRDHILFPQDRWGHEARQPAGYDFLSEIAATAPAGSHNVIFTPWLYGERTPVEDDAIRAGFHNLSLHATRADLVRAVFEGVAFNSRWLLEAVEEFVGRRLDPIAMIGGGANSDLWCQIHADVLQRTVRQVDNPVLANLRGAAFLAFVARGQLGFHDVPERVAIANEYRPDTARGRLYDRLFREFVNIYASNRRIYRRLNRPTSP